MGDLSARSSPVRSRRGATIGAGYRGITPMHGHHADARRRIVKMAMNAAPAIMIPVHRASGFRGYDQLYESKKIVGVAVMKASSSLENFPFVIFH